MKNEAQRLSDFQALSKAANDAKRQFCKECMRTGIRYDAKHLDYQCHTIREERSIIIRRMHV